MCILKTVITQARATFNQSKLSPQQQLQQKQQQHKQQQQEQQHKQQQQQQQQQQNKQQQQEHKQSQQNGQQHLHGLSNDQLLRLNRQHPQLDKLISIANKMTAADVGLPHKGDTLRKLPYRFTAPICHMNILESRHFTMSVFIIRKGQQLPLHDHPGMTGVIKVLYGTINITSYAASGSDSLTLEQHANLDTIPSIRHPDVVLDPSSGCQVNCCFMQD